MSADAIVKSFIDWRTDDAGRIVGLARIGRERLDYDPKSGHLTWRDAGPSAFPTLKGYRIFKRRFAGRRAGNVNKATGYAEVCILGRSILVHRLIWAIVYGYDPRADIDHRDLCRSNNRLMNLREATRSQNSMNRSMRSDNKSGIKGVHWHKATGKWAATICVNGKGTHLGTFLTLEDATEARRAASAKVYGDFARAA